MEVEIDKLIYENSKIILTINEKEINLKEYIKKVIQGNNITTLEITKIYFTIDGIKFDARYKNDLS